MGQTFAGCYREDPSTTEDNLVVTGAAVSASMNGAGRDIMSSDDDHGLYEPPEPKIQYRTCPICASDDVEVSNMKSLGRCGHEMCVDCLTTYVHSKLKDLTQYPINCPFCRNTIEAHILASVLTVDDLNVWDYFSVRKVVKYDEQYECPKCGQLTYRESWKKLDPEDWIADETQPKCMECASDFTLFKRRHHCRSCGRVLCKACSNYSLFSEESNMNVRVCEYCYKEYFLGLCENNDCLCKFCTVCNVEWHSGQTCEQYRASIQNASRLEELTLNAIKALGFAQCPQCGITISKEEGCNHMTHIDCPNAYETNGRTHFCYCCNALLKAPYWHEPEGIVHFEAGLFEPCRIQVQREANEAREHFR